MTSLALFDLGVGFDSPRTRRDDPATSHEAADSNNVVDSRAQVLAILRMVGPLADHEMVDQYDRLAARIGVHYTPQRLRSARAELVRDGLVTLYTKREATTRTGRRAQVWAIA
jgi:hypothetical protein